MTAFFGGYLCVGCGFIKNEQTKIKQIIEETEIIEVHEEIAITQSSEIEDYLNKLKSYGELCWLGDYTGYLDEYTEWPGYVLFNNIDYDLDGTVDRIYKDTNSEEISDLRLEFGNGKTLQLGILSNYSGYPIVKTVI